ncbi:G-type lectin S-receptor-like serine/threonine-protein kinase SD2-5 [Triticum dicoccoides]|uniref:G-type lectin S-receptor-like serine/threonine-protein kinase SD2-5 n=1 Tax=Triticum dicoccoides TaxID=85692 RepID=UPI0018909404|nr:G-type lectin S-receptor-like serine/threonine-protein kinase SD2-5 [Triticum dicoccoides]
MAVASTSSALRLLPLLLALLLAATSEATTFKIINQCSYTVWPAALPGGGVKLDPGETWALNMPAGTSTGRIWARTGCSLLGKGGSCQTGDCSGLLACTVSTRSPITLGEFSLAQGQSDDDFFDISLIDGFNVPMDFLPVPVQGRSGCSKGPRCAANITSQCPRELKAPGGCNNPCTGSTASRCNTSYSAFFKQMCPDAYSKPDDTSTYSCPSGTKYQVIFCPLINQTLSPTDESPLPAPPAKATPPTPSTLPTTIGPTSMKPKSPSGRRVVAILAPVGGLILLTILFLVAFFICKRRTQQQHEMEEEEEFGELEGTPMRFTFQQLRAATEQFADKLGEGGFGSVFKGQFGGERIAVKRLDRTGQGKREFSAEVQTIGGIHHINLVRLIGFCAEKSHRLLVYEYMPKGSLDRWIYCRHDNDASPLDWSTRCKIITHIAKGLSYLHEECTKRIAHLDIKPQNILLYDDFNAKLSDFGLCKLIDRDMSQVVTRMRGTPGYLAPEWLTSQITEKADIYSFGVVVMEIISGRKNLDTSRSEESIHLISLLEEKVNSDRLVDLIDNNSNDMQAHKQDAIQMMMLAMWCLQIDCKKRPKMSEVVNVLEGVMTADLNIEHNFVVTTPANFGSTGNVSSSAPPLASDVSGPR